MIETEIAVIGGGIVGLAVARELLFRKPASSIVLLEKEERVAVHQSGRNSGVIHSGIYYAPGSIKARLARAGCESMKAFCRDHSIPHRTTGKLIIARNRAEVDGLRVLSERAKANRIECHELDASAARELEPAVSCVAALHVPSAGVVDYGVVCERLREEAESRGCTMLFGARVIGIDRADDSIVLRTSRESVRAKMLINAGGLFSDRIAALDGVRVSSRIIPFRGEYYVLRSPSADLVRGLIYPVPDVRYPFLGVHLTRSIDGVVHAGPNAVLALARQGYRWSDVSFRDTLEILGFSGFRRFIGRHVTMAIGEVHRSLSRRRFAKSVMELVPSIDSRDLVRSPAGVRAQALSAGGELVDDFIVEEKKGAVHVLNAPSPAATSSLEIARVVVDHTLKS